jgi:ABC-type transport system involved in multi-copper enzyme maturation permease subunit
MTASTISPYRAPEQPGRDSFLRLMQAEWTKFRTLRGWVIGAILAIVLIDVVAALVPRGECSGGCQGQAAIGPGGEAVNDSYYLVGQPLTGNGSLTVRVTSLTGVTQSQNSAPGQARPGPETAKGTQPWSKAGIIITQSTRPGAAYAALMVTGRNGVRMQYNYTADVAGLPGTVSAASPRWLRLVRSGDTITGYDSADGRHWIRVGQTSLTGLGRSARVGLFATSPLDFTPNFPGYAENGGGLAPTMATGTFDHVSLAGGTGQAWSGQVVDARGVSWPGPQIGYRQTGGRFIITGSGDIGPVASGGVNTEFDTATIAGHLLGVFFGLLIMVVIAAMFITTEYRRGLIATTLTASPRRGRLLAAKALVIGLISFVAGTAAAAVGVLVGKALASSEGIYVLPISALTEIRVMVGVGAMLAVASVLALSLGALLRRSVAAVAAVLVAIVVPYILGASGGLPVGAAQWMLRATPASAFAVEQSVPQYHQVIGQYGPPDYFPLGPLAGFSVLCAYAAVALAAAIYLIRRRDA